jgi:hypothetical protein
VSRFVLLSSILLATAALAGCGGSSGPSGSSSGVAKQRKVVFPAYDGFPAATVSAPASSPPRSPHCRQGADRIAGNALKYVDHYGRAAAYPADLSYLMIREGLADFRVRSCDPALLGDALERKLTAGKRNELLADLPTVYARVMRDALARARS